MLCKNSRSDTVVRETCLADGSGEYPSPGGGLGRAAITVQPYARLIIRQQAISRSGRQCAAQRSIEFRRQRGDQRATVAVGQRPTDFA